jgi:ABC-type phosphate/phosphonate transport system substrate-binding protein
MIAALPMYDWPEIRSATDAFWVALRGRMLAAGFDAPEALTRGGERMALWTAPSLLIAQTCGYPFATRLKDHLALIGTPAYAIGCAPGRYRSVIVAKNARSTLAELACGCLAFNDRESQSGFQAPARLLAASGLPFPRCMLETGAHRDSIRAVADGRADFASIDAVTWELARAHEPAARDLTVIAETPETPGLPFIAAKANAGVRVALADAIREAIAMLALADRRALFIEGFVETSPADYAPLAEPVEGFQPF